MKIGFKMSTSIAKWTLGSKIGAKVDPKWTEDSKIGPEIHPGFQNTLEAPSLENLKFQTDLRLILELFWVPKSMKNRIEI